MIKKKIWKGGGLIFTLGRLAEFKHNWNKIYFHPWNTMVNMMSIQVIRKYKCYQKSLDRTLTHKIVIIKYLSMMNVVYIRA